MNVWGHVALAHVLARRRRADAKVSQVGWTVVGALLPDVVDKGLRLAGVFPWGRTVGHSAYVLTLFALVALLVKREAVFWLMAGWVSHLFADLTDDVICGIQATGYVFATWYTWPYFNPDLNAVRVVPIHAGRACVSVYEAFVVVWALYVGRFRRNG